MTLSAQSHPSFIAARPYLIAALEQGTQGYTLQDVVALLDGNQAVLWNGERSAMVTVVDPCECCGQLVLTVWLGGGDLRELLENGMPNVERWARDAGCIRAEIYGRPGWARVLHRYGWESDGGEMLMKDLT